MKKYHIVYKTTNKITNKIYVGLHSTNSINDKYLGSGWALKSAIKKYGRHNFKKEILYVFPTRKEARKKEALIVDKEFCKRLDTYNIAVGGLGVEDQYGEKNHMYGKEAPNSKKVKAVHKDGTIVKADSIEKLSKIINIARNNIRNLINKNIQGKKGWKVTLID